MLDLKMLGTSYLKCCGLKSKATLKEAQRKLFWGTYGLPPVRPPRWLLLKNCTTKHLENILKTQHQIPNEFRAVICAILNDRENGEICLNYSS
jgi:hypothetical protein